MAIAPIPKMHYRSLATPLTLTLTFWVYSAYSQNALSEFGYSIDIDIDILGVFST